MLFYNTLFGLSSFNMSWFCTKNMFFLLVGKKWENAISNMNNTRVEAASLLIGDDAGLLCYVEVR